MGQWVGLTDALKSEQVWPQMIEDIFENCFLKESICISIPFIWITPWVLLTINTLYFDNGLVSSWYVTNANDSKHRWGYITASPQGKYI